MFLSVFDVFKIGIGPSSSHTMGPMTAAVRFLDMLKAHPGKAGRRAVRARLHGSLAFTGKGHATDRAVVLGLLGHQPADLDVDAAEKDLAELRRTGTLRPAGLPRLSFDPDKDLVFDYGPPLPGHANGLVIEALDEAGSPSLRKRSIRSAAASSSRRRSGKQRLRRPKRRLPAGPIRSTAPPRCCAWPGKAACPSPP